jgi:hypothetical protein
MNAMLAREKWQVRTIEVLEEVFRERQRQVKRYGHNDDLGDGTGPDVGWVDAIAHINDRWNAVQIEKAFRADYVDHEARTGKPTWMHLIREEVAEAFEQSDPDRLEEELLQVAALCVSWVETIRGRS